MKNAIKIVSRKLKFLYNLSEPAKTTKKIMNPRFLKLFSLCDPFRKRMMSTKLWM